MHTCPALYRTHDDTRILRLCSLRGTVPHLDALQCFPFASKNGILLYNKHYQGWAPGRVVGDRRIFKN